MLKRYGKKAVALLLAAVMVLGMTLVAPLEVSAANTTYYVDSVAGDDSNNGTSTSTPWKTLTKVNATTFSSGDKILFKAGGVWNGQLWPKGSGTSGSPIVIDMYGAGNKPIINGNGTNYPAKHSGAVMLYNQSYWEINNLEVTNYSSTVTSDRAAILVYSCTGIVNHVYVRNCYVHDVNSNTAGYKITGGIIFSGTNIDKDGGNTATDSGFNDVLVEGCRVYNVTKEGIRTKSDNNGAYPRVSSNIIFRNNSLEEIWGDAVVMSEIKSGGLAEYNVIKRHSLTSSGNYAGLWTHYSTGTVLQYNEVFDGIAGYNDGEAFDSDNNCTGEVFQYNYSHNNKGGFMLIMPSATNLTVRYNVSENDGNGTELFHYTGNTATTNQFYNNTFYIGSGITTTIFKSSSGTSRAVKFYNNIIRSDGTVSKFSDGTWAAGTEFKNNCFYPATIDDVGGPSSHTGLITSDPKLTNPGGAVSNIDMKSAGKLPGYQLQSDSPCINTGLSITGNGGKDFWGNPLYSGNPDIGAHEYQGTVIPPALTVNPSGDAYVRDGSYASTNYGTATTMMVKADAAGYARKSYVKFDFGAFSGTSTTNAKLRLYISNVNTDAARTVKVYGTSDESWSESGITWNNAPAGSTLVNSAVIGNTTGVWCEIDVTSYVNSNMSDKTVSFLLVNEGAASSKGDVTFNTKEASSNKPELVLQ